nr:MAG TPA: hypothetical protein [Caudoviricetes sp.]
MANIETIDVLSLPKADKVLKGDTLLLIRPKDGSQECYRVESADFRGEDAYDVAKAGGYTGTRDEWVAQIQRVSMVDIGFDEEKGAIVIRS